MKGTRTFESQLKRFFEIDSFMKNPLYCGNMMIAEIGEKTRVKISFDCTGVIPGDSALYFGNRYDAVAVTIINKNKGMIDSNFFRFQDICSSHPYFVCTETGEIVWMRETTGDFMKIARKIIAYIKLFAELPEKETVKQKSSAKETPVKKDVPKVGDNLWIISGDDEVLKCTVVSVGLDQMAVVFENDKRLTHFFSLDSYPEFFFSNEKEVYDFLAMTKKKENKVAEKLPAKGDTIWFANREKRMVIPYTVLCFDNANFHVNSKTGLELTYSFPREMYGKLFFLDKNKASEVLKKLLGEL